PFHEYQKFLDSEYKYKHIEVKKQIMDKVKEIIMLTMNSVKEKINLNRRKYSFEIFGFDFMMDEDFNVFLIEANTNPGLEESSPWINVIVPRMLDDALRITLDKIFPPKYEFGEDKKIKIEDCANSIVIKEEEAENKEEVKTEKKKEYVEEGTGIEKEENKTVELNKETKIEKENKRKENKASVEEEKKTNTINSEIQIEISPKIENDIHKTQCSSDNQINSKETNSLANSTVLEKKEGTQNENINTTYISPFPVPGYTNNENLWEFLGYIGPVEKKPFTGIKHLLSKKQKS
ncbi:MAG: tubulin--tyrosine ligase family protein, partial [archaeon]|nr:tubulin--tyrosine ligase family protein [archaeon]